MSRVNAVKEGRVGPKFVTMELFNRGMSKLKIELQKALKKKKDVNVPGETKRGYKGMVAHMVSMADGRFNKMIKDIKARRRTPHKG